MGRERTAPRGARRVARAPPDLTPVAAVEVRRAFEACRWKPAVGPDGERVEGSVTLAVHR